MQSAAAPLMNTIMRDGSRHFLALRETARPDEIRARLEAIYGIRICQFSRGGFEWWMFFQCMGWRFSVNNPFGEIWFFVDDPICPEDILNCLKRRIAQALA
jgi:hypothetical protein